MPKHVVFLGPDIFSPYADLVRGLKQVGARVTGIGHTPTAGLSKPLRWHLDHYVRVGSLASASTIADAVREIARRRDVDLLETGELAQLGHGADGGRGGTGHSGLPQRFFHRRLVAAQRRRGQRQAGQTESLTHLRRHRHLLQR